MCNTNTKNMRVQFFLLISLVALCYGLPQQPSFSYDEAAEEEQPQYDHVTAASTRPRAVTYSIEDDPYVYQNAIAQPKQQQGLRRNYPQQFRLPDEEERAGVATKKGGKKGGKLEEEEELEEPDRLTQLLPQSQFTCAGKNTGYYADEQLGCEVFHYCQESAKHSWICPEGFTFHQVHLICMPPGGDNICDKSSKYHFVNDYLYKPVNLEEYQRKPNVSLKYSDRYYPENYYSEQDNYEDGEPQQTLPHRNSVRVRDPDVAPKGYLAEPQVARSTQRPDTSLNQVFRSPNEVNIPLQQRRPVYVTQRYL